MSTSTKAVKPSSATWRGVGCGPNRTINPMLLDMHRAKNCGAKTRIGKPCQSPAMPNGRCRMHGGPSPGAPKGNQNAFKHGRYSALSVQERRRFAALISKVRETEGAVTSGIYPRPHEGSTGHERPDVASLW
jgi:hypothetical protein